MSAGLTLFQRFILRDVIKNWVRTLLTLIGIALGVAVVLAISIATNTAVGQFKDTVNLISGKANLELYPISEPFLNQTCLEQIRWLWSADTKFSPIITANVTLDNKGNTLAQLLGVDILADPEFDAQPKKTVGSNESNKPDSSSESSGINSLQPNTALIGARLASDCKLHVGDTFEVFANEKPYKLKIVQLLTPTGLGSAFGGNMIIVDLLTAQNALGIQGKISQVEIIAPDSNREQIKHELEIELPADVKVQQPERRGAQIDKMTRSFQYNLLALTFIALLVGMFLIYNTMTISVIRRRSEIGTLRALGVSRSGILMLFGAEALWFGIVGSALGVGLGMVFAQGALGAVSTTFQHFYISQPLEQVSFELKPLILAFCLGVVATVIASIAPAIEAANVPPGEAVKRASNEAKINRNTKKLALAAILALALGAGAALAPPIYNFPVFGYLAALLWIAGCSLMMPVVLQYFLPAVSNLCGRIGQSEARIAARSLHGALARTSIVSASLMIGISMMVSLAIMIGSFRQTVLTWVEQTLKADLWVQTTARADGSRLARMKADTIEKIKSIDGVVAVDGFVNYMIEYKDEPTNLAAADLDVVTKYGNLKFTSGETGGIVYKRMGENDCIVSETFAIRKNVKTGQLISLPTPHGQLNSKVQGIYYDYASDLGYIVISRPTFYKYFDDNSISSCAIYISPLKDAYVIREAIFRKLGNDKHLSIQTTHDLRHEAIKVFDRTFAVTYALHTIAIVVAMLAITNALFALTLESRRDFGILRYLGASAGQLRKIVLIQAGLLGVIGNVAGIILGFLLSMILIYVINLQSFGWTIQLSLPFVFLAQSSILVICTAILAGLWPARLAAITQAPKVIHEE